MVLRSNIQKVLLVLLLTVSGLLCGGTLLAQSAVAGQVRTPDVTLAYDTLGTDRSLPPIVAINGGPGLTHAYMVQNDLWQRVAKSRRVVFYDQRGLGRSVPRASGAPQTLDAQVADLDAVRDALHAELIDVVGDSFGGLVALAYTLAHPDHVRRLVVSDGLPGLNAIVHPMPDIFPDLELEQEAHAKAMLAGKARDEYNFSTHLRKCFYSPELAAKYLQGFHDFGLNNAVGEQVSAAIKDVDLSSRLGTITTPALILTGRFDVNVAPLTAWRMAKAIPGAQFHVFEHSGHLPSYEEPEEYLRVLMDFLSR